MLLLLFGVCSPPKLETKTLLVHKHCLDDLCKFDGNKRKRKHGGYKQANERTNEREASIGLHRPLHNNTRCRWKPNEKFRVPICEFVWPRYYACVCIFVTVWADGRDKVWEL